MLETKNVKYVAYLRFIGIHPDHVDKIARGRAKYGFKIEPDKWDQLKKDFDRSDYIKYAQCIDAVVDLAY